MLYFVYLFELFNKNSLTQRHKIKFYLIFSKIFFFFFLVTSDLNNNKKKQVNGLVGQPVYNRVSKRVNLPTHQLV